MSKPTVDGHMVGAADDEGEIIWVGEFNDDTARNFVTEVFKASAKDPKKPIIVYIDSPGGQVDSLASMVAALDAVPNQIVTVGMGYAMSAGAMLLSHGDIRYISPVGRVMVHEISAAAFGNINDMKTDVKEFDRMGGQWMKWLASNCRVSLKTLLKRFSNQKREIYLSPEEAVEFGIVDRIGIPVVKQVITYELR